MQKHPLLVVLITLLVQTAGCDAFKMEPHHDARFIAVNSGQQTALISGESYDAVTKRWRPLEDEVSPGEEVLLRSVGVADDFKLSSLFRDLIVYMSNEAPVDAMPDEFWTKVQNADRSYVYTLDVGLVLAPQK